MAAYAADPADDPAVVIEFQPQNTASKGRPERISTVENSPINNIKSILYFNFNFNILDSFFFLSFFLSFFWVSLSTSHDVVLKERQTKENGRRISNDRWPPSTRLFPCRIHRLLDWLGGGEGRKVPMRQRRISSIPRIPTAGDEPVRWRTQRAKRQFDQSTEREREKREKRDRTFSIERVWRPLKIRGSS